LIFSPQPPKDPSQENNEENDFFPSDSENVNYIVHLNDTTFDEFIAENSQSPILTMFYAPCEYILSFSQDQFVCFRVWTL